VSYFDIDTLAFQLVFLPETDLSCRLPQGRIHRLGQNKPCEVVKFAFRRSYEANIIKLHDKISKGEIALVDGFVPYEAMKILAEGLRVGSG